MSILEGATIESVILTQFIGGKDNEKTKSSKED